MRTLSKYDVTDSVTGPFDGALSIAVIALEPSPLALSYQQANPGSLVTGRAVECAGLAYCGRPERHRARTATRSWTSERHCRAVQCSGPGSAAGSRALPAPASATARYLRTSSARRRPQPGSPPIHRAGHRGGGYPRVRRLDDHRIRRASDAY